MSGLPGAGQTGEETRVSTGEGEGQIRDVDDDLEGLHRYKDPNARPATAGHWVVGRFRSCWRGNVDPPTIFGYRASGEYADQESVRAVPLCAPARQRRGHARLAALQGIPSEQESSEVVRRAGAPNAGEDDLSLSADARWRW